MYTAKYSTKSTTKRARTSEGKVTESSSRRTRLVAKFRFYDEVAPDKRVDVERRICGWNALETQKGALSLKDYLFFVTSFFEKPGKPFNGYIDLRGSDGICISCSFPVFAREPSFNLVATAKSQSRLEELLDLDALDHFVLTGEYERKGYPK